MRVFQLGLILSVVIVISGCARQQTVMLPSESPKAERSMDHSGMAHAVVLRSEKDFLENTIPHHEEAVQTSQIVESRTLDQDVKKFTQDVVRGQSAEVVLMKQWYRDWYGQAYASTNVYQPMMSDLAALNGPDLERTYISEMIGHHQGAIDMAQQVLMLNPKPEIKKMAEDIIAVQTTENQMLEQWLVNKY